MTSSADNRENEIHERLWQLATAVREACFVTAVTAYEDASTDGLCHDGAWECALEAMRLTNFAAIVTRANAERERGC